MNQRTEHDEKQDQIPGHPDELVTLPAFTFDEVVVRRHMIRIIEDFLRRNSIPTQRDEDA